MIVGEPKPLDELKEKLRGKRKVLAVGCGTCVTVCFAGGKKEVGLLSSALRMASRVDGEEAEIELITEREAGRYVTRTLTGRAAGSEIWTTLRPATEHETRVTVAFEIGANGVSEWIDLELPDDLSSLTLHVRGAAEQYYVVQRFEGPDGTEILSEDDDIGLSPFDGSQLRSSNPSMVGYCPGRADFMAPNSPRVSLMGGRSRFRVEGFAFDPDEQQWGAGSGKVDVTATIKRLPSPWSA